jgi:hypothetical protein
MGYSRRIEPSPIFSSGHTSEELNVLLCENAQLRRTAAELMLETTILREALTFRSRTDQRFETAIARL